MIRLSGPFLLLLAALVSGCATSRFGASRLQDGDEPSQLAASAPSEWEQWSGLSAPPEAPDVGVPVIEIEELPLDALPEGASLPGLSGSAASATKAVRVVRAVEKWVGLRSLRKVSRKVPDDCSGLVRLVYGRFGVDPIAGEALRGDNAVTAIWRHAYRLGALKRSSPKPGDLVFFRNTWDRNRDGRPNDGLTHVGVVERVEPDGTVIFIHRAGSGVRRGHLRIDRPGERADESGRVLNDYVRHADRSGAPRLAGQLFAGFASFASLASIAGAE